MAAKTRLLTGQGSATAQLLVETLGGGGGGGSTIVVLNQGVILGTVTGLNAGIGLTMQIDGGDPNQANVFVDTAFNFTGVNAWSGNHTFNANVVFGNASTDTVTFTSHIASDLVPSVTSTYVLGSSTLLWLGGHFSGVGGVMVHNDLTNEQWARFDFDTNIARIFVNPRTTALSSGVSFSLLSGTGGPGTGGAASGKGGDILINAASAGSDGGAGSGVAGQVQISGGLGVSGTATSNATNGGTVMLGMTVTQAGGNSGGNGSTAGEGGLTVITSGNGGNGAGSSRGANAGNVSGVAGNGGSGGSTAGRAGDGGAFGISGGNGGTNTGFGSGVGGAVTVLGGVGSTANASVGGAGGTVLVKAGNGGEGTGTAQAGAGADCFIKGGDAGTPHGGGASIGGGAYIDGGSGGVANGGVFIGAQLLTFVSIGFSSAARILMNGRLGTDVVPITDDLYNLGTTALSWASVHVTTSSAGDGLYIHADATNTKKTIIAYTTGNPSITTGGDAIVFDSALGKSGGSIGFLGSALHTQQVSGADLTNNVTAGGTDNVIADYGDLNTYSVDAPTIRNDIYQLARKLKQVNDALRLYGLLS